MSNYRIVIRGIAEGRSVEQVAAELARVSMKSPAHLARLLDGRVVVAKRTTDMQKAVRYRLALEKMGCICRIEAEITPGAAAATQAAAAPASVTVNLTSTAYSEAPAQPREFQYANYPLLARVHSMSKVLRIKEWIAAAGLIVVLYHVGLRLLQYT